MVFGIVWILLANIQSKISTITVCLTFATVHTAVVINCFSIHSRYL